MGFLEREAPEEGFDGFIEHKRRTMVHQRENIRVVHPLMAQADAHQIVKLVRDSLWRINKHADEYTASIAYVQFAREKDFYGYHAVPLSFDPASPLNRVVMTFESVVGTYSSLKFVLAALLDLLLSHLRKPISACIVEAVNIHAYTLL